MDSKGDFITVKPKDPLAQKHISYYYFHISTDIDYHSKFFFYPNYKHALTIYKGSDVMIDSDGSVVRESKEQKLSFFYTVNSDRNIKVDIKGSFNKIGVVFNPLGINHFISTPLNEVFTKGVAVFDYFKPDLEIVANRVYEESDAEKKGELLDAFFASRYCTFDEPVVKKALQEILNSNGSIRVEELSDATGVNRKTLLRMFNKHLCCSVEEYKKMVMFRNALNYSQESNEHSLTDVALYSLYYDQAHFIKHFKSVTQQSPKVLLSKLTKLGTQETYWNFEE
jgi:AraC-like DNA-binding protein